MDEITDKDLMNELFRLSGDVDTFNDKLSYTADVLMPEINKALVAARRRIAQLVKENEALKAQLQQQERP